MGMEAIINFHWEKNPPSLSILQRHSASPQEVKYHIKLLFMFYTMCIESNIFDENDIAFACEYFFQFKSEEGPTIELCLYKHDHIRDFIYDIELSEDEWKITTINKIYSSNQRNPFGGAAFFGDYPDGSPCSDKQKWLEAWKPYNDKKDVEILNQDSFSLDRECSLMFPFFSALKRAGKRDRTRFMPLINIDF